MSNSQKEFHLAFGQAMGQWSLIEERLSYWFQDSTGLPYEMARSIFFSPRVFQSRTDILEAALEHPYRLCECSVRFARGAIKKSLQFNSFRNSLAHGEQTFDARSNSPTFKQTILISGRKHPELAAATAVTVAKLRIASENFRELAKVLMDATGFVNGTPDAVQPEECLRQVNAMPNQADSPRHAQTA